MTMETGAARRPILSALDGEPAEVMRDTAELMAWRMAAADARASALEDQCRELHRQLAMAAEDREMAVRLAYEQGRSDERLATLNALRRKGDVAAYIELSKRLAA